jgi:hypothetical protein
MLTFSTGVEIDAAPARVWAVMTDVERWPEWTASVISVKRLDTGPFRVGSRARVRQLRLFAADWDVTALDPEKGFTWVTRSPGLVVFGHHRLEPAGAGTRVHLQVDFTGSLGPLVGRLMGRLNRRFLALEAAGLKRRSEGK